MNEKVKRVFNAKILIPVATAVISVVFIWMGLGKYGFWHQMKGPMPGFFPVIIGFAMLAVSVLAFFQSLKEEAPDFPVANWLVPLGLLALVAASYIIGMIPSIAIYMLVWLKWYEKCTWKATIIAFVIIMAIVVGAFAIWLRIDFPKGIIYNLIFR